MQVEGGRGHDHAHDHGHDHAQARGDHEHGHTTGILGHIGALLGLDHAHDTAERVDDALVSSARGIRAVKISLVGLGTTAILQLIVALSSGSVALLADTIHNFSDALTAVPLWIAFSLGRRAATDRHRYGFGRAEDLAGVFIVLMILASAILAAWQAIERLIHPQPITDIGWVMAAAVVGWAGNEAVAVYRIREGRSIGSAALVADGLHARTDGFTSLAVLFGALGVLAGFPAADPLVGLAIAAAILFVLRSAVIQVFGRLMDAVEPEVVAATRQALLGVSGIEAANEVRLRWVGHRLWAQADIVVDRDRSLAEAHAIAERGRHGVLHDVPRVVEVDLHVDPCEHAGEGHHDETAHHFARRERPAAAHGGRAYARYLGFVRHEASLRAALESWRAGDAGGRDAARHDAQEMAALAAATEWPHALRSPAAAVRGRARALESALASADEGRVRAAATELREALHVVTHTVYESWLPGATDALDVTLVASRAEDLRARVDNIVRRAVDWESGNDLGRRICLELAGFADVIAAPAAWPAALAREVARSRAELAALRTDLDRNDGASGRIVAERLAEGAAALYTATLRWVETSETAREEHPRREGRPA